MIPQEKHPFSKIISLYICIFFIFHDQVICKVENFLSLFMGRGGGGDDSQSFWCMEFLQLASFYGETTPYTEFR